MDNRYYFDEINNDIVTLTGGEAQHLSKVRRAKIGDSIVGFNGDGYDYFLTITEITKDEVKAKLNSKELNRASKDDEITVYLAMTKNEALTTAVDHLAEMNVKHVKLFKSDFSVAVVDEHKLNKLNNVALQASKQCERADIMQISIIDKKEIEKDIKAFKNRFFAYENSSNLVPSFSGGFAVIIGPEGGFSSAEAEYFSRIATNISLGNTILRTEVACVASIATLKVVKYAR